MVSSINFSSSSFTQVGSFSSSSGNLSAIGDKIGGITQNINALVDKLMGENQVLQGLQQELRDMKAEISNLRNQKAAMRSPTAPDASLYKKADGTWKEGGEAKYNAAVSAFNTDKSKFDAEMKKLDDSIARLQDKCDATQTKIDKQEAEISKTEHDIDSRKRDLANAQSELRQAQAGGTSSASGSSAAGSVGSSESDIEDANLNRAEQARTNLRTENDRFSYASTRNTLNLSVTCGAATAQSAGIDAQDSGRVPTSVSDAWHAGPAADFNKAINSGDTAAAQSQWASFINDIHSNGMPVDVNALVQQVLRESYVDTTQDLQFYAEKVQYFNEAKKACREFVQDLRDMKTQVSDQLSEKKICYSDIGSDKAAEASKIISEFFGGQSVDCSGKYAKDLGLNEVNLADIKTTDDLDNLISKFEEKLSTLGDDSQLANTDLQNVLQKQQQTIQMMSNISKMLSDTALAVIRKIG